LGLLLAPLLVAESCWVGANYAKRGEVFLLQSRFYYTPNPNMPEREVARAFVNAWGGREAFWDPSGDVTWFVGPRPDRELSPQWERAGLPEYQKDIFPPYIYTPDYTLDSLKSIRQDLWRFRDSSLAPAQRQAALQRAMRKFREYRRSFIQHRPFHYYVTASLHSLMTYLKFTFPAPPPELSSLKHWRLLFIFSLHVAMLVGGGLGLLLLAVRYWPLGAAPAALAAYFTLIYPVVLRLTQQRYLQPAFPFYLLGLAFGVWVLVHYLRTSPRRSQKSSPSSNRSQNPT
jgi:hypothetical protein